MTDLVTEDLVRSDTLHDQLVDFEIVQFAIVGAAARSGLTDINDLSEEQYQHYYLTQPTEPTLEEIKSFYGSWAEALSESEVDWDDRFKPRVMEQLQLRLDTNALDATVAAADEAREHQLAQATRRQETEMRREAEKLNLERFEVEDICEIIFSSHGSVYQSVTIDTGELDEGVIDLQDDPYIQVRLRDGREVIYDGWTEVKAMPEAIKQLWNEKIKTAATRAGRRAGTYQPL